MVRLLSRLLCALPLSWTPRLARAFGWLWYWLVPVRIGVAKKNVARALPGLDARTRSRIVRRNCDHLALVGIETLRLPLMGRALAQTLVTTHGYDHLHAELAKGKGVIVVTAHVGNFALFGASQAAAGEPLGVILKELGYRAANDFWRDVQNKTGIRHIPAKRSKERIREELLQGRIVAMPIDQHQPKHRAIVCSFFGQLAATSPAPARFAYETGASIVTAYIRRKDDDWTQHEVFVEPFALESPHTELKDNLRHNTERLNRVVEAWVRAHPEQWLWMHKRFKVHDAPAGWDVPPALQSLLRA